MTDTIPSLVLIGRVIQASDNGTERRLEVIHRARIDVLSNGVIARVEDVDEAEVSAIQASHPNVVVVPHPQLIIPGLIDLHFHAPQLPQRGTRMDVPLATWLRDTTLPNEARMSETAHAEKVAHRVVDRTLALGTTTAVYFSSKHASASTALANECRRRGQRAFVGKVCMDNKELCSCSTTDACVCTEDSVDESIRETRTFINSFHHTSEEEDPLVQPIITPRFIPSCSPALLDQLGSLTREFNLHMQTHAWESDWQVQHGLDTRDGARDLDLFSRHGLLAPRGTVLAHCVHATGPEIAALAHLGVGVAHCALSNALFANGILPARTMLDAGVAVGLGTDVGGAWSCSILDACRHAIVSSRILRDGVGALRGGKPCLPNESELTHVDAFWMATVGGGRALKRRVGIRTGCKLDALVVDVDAPGSNIDVWPELDTVEDLFQKFILLGDDRNIRRVFVDGKTVLQKE
ncbi:putative guanine deaminase [Chytriomyces sp. MP71]|nr:putative guanine deaminase [Chytriomyces sp. MP71]